MLNCGASHTPGVHLAQRDVQPLGDVLHRLVALRDDAHTFSDGLRCDRVVSSHHDDLTEGTQSSINYSSLSH